jgi:hypothetical protein
MRALGGGDDLPGVRCLVGEPGPASGDPQLGGRRVVARHPGQVRTYSEMATKLHITPRGCVYRFRKKILDAAYRGRITIPEAYLNGHRGAAR